MKSKSDKKYCIYDKRVGLCKSIEGSYVEIKKLFDKLKENSPNRYEIREVK